MLNRLSLLVLLALTGCGGASGPGSGNPIPGIPGALGGIPMGSGTVGGFAYQTDRSYAEFWVPSNQVGDYQIQFCESPYSFCQSVLIQCTSPLSCSVTSGAAGAVGVQPTINGLLQISYSKNTGGGGTYYGRMRTTSSSIGGSAAWITAPNCGFSLPAYCHN